MALIDVLRGRKEQEEQTLSDILRRPDTFKTSDIEGRREQFLREALAGLPEQYQASANASIGRSSSRLGRELESTTGRRQLEFGRQSRELIFNNLVRRAQDAGASQAEAIDFARQNMLDIERRQAESAENVAQRESTERKQTIAEQYQQAGIDLEGSIDEGDPVSQALARIAGGVAGIGAGYGLARYFNRPTQPEFKPKRGFLSEFTMSSPRNIRSPLFDMYKGIQPYKLPFASRGA